MSRFICRIVFIKKSVVCMLFARYIDIANYQKICKSMMNSSNRTTNPGILFSPILYTNISQLERLKNKGNVLFVRLFFSALSSWKNNITNIGEKNGKTRFVVWSDDLITMHTKVRLGNFLSGGFSTAIEVNLPERNLVKRTSV